MRAWSLQAGVLFRGRPGQTGGPQAGLFTAGRPAGRGPRGWAGLCAADRTGQGETVPLSRSARTPPTVGQGLCPSRGQGAGGRPRQGTGGETSGPAGGCRPSAVDPSDAQRPCGASGRAGASACVLEQSGGSGVWIRTCLQGFCSLASGACCPCPGVPSPCGPLPPAVDTAVPELPPGASCCPLEDMVVQGAGLGGCRRL